MIRIQAQETLGEEDWFFRGLWTQNLILSLLVQSSNKEIEKKLSKLLSNKSKN